MSYVTHAGAALNPAGRLKIVQLVVNAGWAQACIAERFQVASGHRVQVGGPVSGRGRGRTSGSVVASLSSCLCKCRV